MTEIAGVDSATLRERQRTLGTAWIVILFVTFFAIAIPWYLRLAGDIELASLVWAVFVFTLVFLGSAAALERAARLETVLWGGLALQLAGVLFLVMVWQRMGGLQSPEFLMLLVLPVVGSGLLPSRLHPLLVTLVTLVAVTAVAIGTSAELRWHLGQLGLPLGTLDDLLPAATGRTTFGDEIGPRRQLVALVAFAAAVLGAGLVTQSVATLLVEIAGRLGLTGEARREAESLAQHVLRAGSLPSLLMYSDTGQVVEVSDSFLERHFFQREDLAGQSLYDLIELAYPEAVQEVVTAGGEVPFTSYRIGAEARVVRLLATVIEHRSGRFTYLVMEELNQLHALQSALRELPEPLLVLGEDSRLLYFNRAAEALFGDLYFGQTGAELLAAEGLPGGWWRSRDGRFERNVSLRGQPFRAACVASRLAAGGEDLSVLTLRPREASP